MQFPPAHRLNLLRLLLRPFYDDHGRTVSVILVIVVVSAVSILVSIIVRALGTLPVIIAAGCRVVAAGSAHGAVAATVPGALRTLATLGSFAIVVVATARRIVAGSAHGAVAATAASTFALAFALLSLFALFTLAGVTTGRRVTSTGADCAIASRHTTGRCSRGSGGSARSGRTTILTSLALLVTLGHNMVNWNNIIPSFEEPCVRR